MKIDAELSAALDQVLTLVPGGFNAPDRLEDRRASVNSFLAENPVNENVVRDDLSIPSGSEVPDVGIRIYQPKDFAANDMGALMVIHGGGMVMGSVETDDVNAAFLCETLGVLTLAVDYRLAPENPFPAGLEDCYTAALWLFNNAATLGGGFNPKKIILYGGSAGGGLAIALAMLLRDREQPNFSSVVASYPMLDDRNVTKSSFEIVNLGIWDRRANLESWEWYLGEDFGSEGVSVYAAPSRATNLKNLPPMFIDVGSCDLFRDENIEFVERLKEQGNQCEFHLYAGVYHAAELFAPEAALSQEIWGNRISSMRKSLSERGE